MCLQKIDVSGCFVQCVQENVRRIFRKNVHEGQRWKGRLWGKQLLPVNGFKTIPCSPGPSPVHRPSQGGRTPVGQGFSRNHWPLFAADQFRKQRCALLFCMALCAIGRHSRPGKKYLVGVHRLETVAVFPSLFGGKKRQFSGRLLSAKKQETKQKRTG